MTDKLIEAVARGIWDRPVGHKRVPYDLLDMEDQDVFRAYARAAIAAIEAAGYDLVLRQHRDMGPGFTHHDGADCPCFDAAPKVIE